MPLSPSHDRPKRLALLGVPLQRGAGAAGTLMGPAALRTAGLVDMLTALGHTVEDHGDMATPAPVAPLMDPTAAGRCNHLAENTGWIRAIEARAHALAGSGAVPIFIGGDHALSMGSVAGVARHCADAGRDLVVLWLDAHADFNTPATTPSGNMHGMSVAYLAGDASLAPLGGPDFVAPAVRPADLHLFGVRSIDRDERKALADHGIAVTDMRQIDEHGVATLLRRLLGRLEGRNVHLHVSFDADFLDPDLAPGVGTAVPGGATYREAHLVMEMLHDSGLVGSVDIVELNPFLDLAGRTAKVVAEMTASLFGLTVLDRQPG